jgi:hypothetical protein
MSYNSDSDSDDEREREINEENARLLEQYYNDHPEGDEWQPEPVEYQDDHLDNLREENIDLLELFVEHFNSHDDFIKTAENRNNISYNLFTPTPGNLYLVISRKFVYNDDRMDMNITPVVEESTAYIGRLTSLTRPSFESPTTYEFSKLCKLKKIKNGIITSEKCTRDSFLTSNYQEQIKNKYITYTLYCFPIEESSIKQYFPGFERLTLEQRIAATQAMEGLPPELMDKVLSFSEYNTPGHAIIRKYPGSTAETRAPDPNETVPTEEEFEKMYTTTTKRRDTKGGKKTKRRRVTRKSRKNKRKHTRRRK